MNDIFSTLDRLKRPRLLIQAARAGVDDYRRDPHLRRLLGYGKPPRSGEALIRLIELEAHQNDKRRESDTTYSLVSHVDILIALLGEARLLRTAYVRPELVSH